MAYLANNILSARSLVSSNDYVKALNKYMCIIDQYPQSKTQLAHEFRVVLGIINSKLAAAQKKEDIFINFEKAIKIYPDSGDLLNDIGNYLYKYGYMIEALCHYEKALTMDNSYSRMVEENFNDARTFLFPRSQFKILNDKIRNSAYSTAIRYCVTRADSVIEIGAGTGLLALYASRSKPVVVFASESSKAMAQIAKSVMQDNDAHEVVVLNKPSVTLEFTDKIHRKSVLVTDAFDSGLFGEYVLQSLCHAWEKLLNWNSIVIPAKAEYFIAGIKCDELYKKYKLDETVKDMLNITDLNVHSIVFFGDTYCSDDVHLYKDVKYMSEPESLFTIDFNSLPDICEKLESKEPYTVELAATSDGEINNIIGWFNLYLSDDITLTSDPRSPNRASGYQQAVFFDVPSKRVRRNDTLSISFMTDGRLATLHDTNMKITRISQETLAFLNDTDLTSLIINCVSAVTIYLGQTVVMDEVEIVDLSAFPLFGVLMMKRGAKSLICHAKTGYDKKFLQSVLVANDIPNTKVTILVNEYWSKEAFVDKQFHVIFGEYLDMSGDINEVRYGIIQQLKESHVLPGGLCLPLSINRMSQLIYSKYLEMNNQIVDDNVNCYMAKHVNRYSVSQMLHLDVARLDYEALSEIFEVPSYEDQRSTAVKVPILKDGVCNAILTWYKVKILDDWEEIYTNKSNSFVQSMAYMVGPKTTKMFKGDEANVLKCVDPLDKRYKLVLEVENQPVRN